MTGRMLHAKSTKASARVHSSAVGLHGSSNEALHQLQSEVTTAADMASLLCRLIDSRTFLQHIELDAAVHTHESAVECSPLTWPCTCGY